MPFTVALALTLTLALGLAAWVNGCGRTPPAGRADAPAIALVDADGHGVRLTGPAARVVSLLPGATETVVALGAADRLVARTRYDVMPALRHLPSVGGGLDASVERIVASRPDLVIVAAEGKGARLRRDLEAGGIVVFSLRTQDTTDVFRSIAVLGRLLGRDSAAAGLGARLRRDLDAVRRSVAGRRRPTVFYVVWNNPSLTAGPRTFIGQLLSLAGGETIFPDVAQQWPTVGLEQVVRRQPDIVVLPVGEMRATTNEELALFPGWRDIEAVRRGRVARPPADLLTRPGPNIGEAARVLRDALHPDLAAGR